MFNMLCIPMYIVSVIYYIGTYLVYNRAVGTRGQDPPHILADTWDTLNLFETWGLGEDYAPHITTRPLPLPHRIFRPSYGPVQLLQGYKYRAKTCIKLGTNIWIMSSQRITNFYCFFLFITLFWYFFVLLMTNFVVLYVSCYHVDKKITVISC